MNPSIQEGRSAEPDRSAGRMLNTSTAAEGAATRAEVTRLAQVAQRRIYEMAGTERGYTYAGSPIVCGEGEPPHESDFIHYLPSSSPGARFPDAWLSDGRALHDLAGTGYTLFDFSDNADTAPMVTAFRKLGAPLDVARPRDQLAYQTCGRRFVLLRPDLHVAWRADVLPDDCDAVARVVTGHVHPSSSTSTTSIGVHP